MTNEFWTFSLALYAREGVAESCVAAQDSLGLDVNFVLYAAWLAHLGLQLTPAHRDALDSVVKPWRARVVVPLRNLRRDLKGYTEAEGIRESVASLELQAEQYQQALMWEHHGSAPPLVSGENPLAQNLGLLIGPGEEDHPDWRALSRVLDLHLEQS